MNATFLRYHLPAILWAMAIFGFSSLPGSAIPNLSIFSQDKLLHAGVFFVFAFLVYRSFQAQKRLPSLSRHAGIWTLVVATVYGVIDEVHQVFVSGRSADYRDVAADAVGALSLLSLMWILKRLQKRRDRG